MLLATNKEKQIGWTNQLRKVEQRLSENQRIQGIRMLHAVAMINNDIWHCWCSRQTIHNPVVQLLKQDPFLIVSDVVYVV